MPRVCKVCKWTTKIGRNKSFSMQRSSRTYKQNLQSRKIKDTEWVSKKVRICTKCLKTYKKYLSDSKVGSLSEFVEKYS